MILYAVYDPATGKIRRAGSCVESDLPVIDAKAAESGHAAIERADPTHHDGNAYVDLTGEPTVTARPDMPATIDGLTISGIPAGAVLTIEGVDYTVDDGEAELSFTLPGTYQVKLSLWPYLDKVFEVVST